MDKNNVVVIMAGGAGERFWPMSRDAKPKQFIDILGTGKSLIRQTYERFLKLCPPENIYIITNKNYKTLVQEQIPEIRSENIFCEPTRKNTAPCIAYAAYKIYAANPDANMVVAPSDHIILKEDAFCEIVTTALKASAGSNKLITLGITPSRPDTEYGYIQFIQDSINKEDKRMKKVKTFTEKPNKELAESFIQSGDFLWNSGIFVWSAKTIINAFEKHQPELNFVFKEAIPHYNTNSELDYMKTAYEACKSISIDYAIMEKAENVFVFISDLGWSDLGSWRALFEYRPKDSTNNAICGNNILVYDSKNCIITMPKDKMVLIQGLDDYIVAESDNVLMICKKSQEGQIRKFVNDIKINTGEKYI
ncbi:MAG: mannose-1-phosphate guanylyltransferase [Bacteroidetes bacterium]|nr:mannose-1-phosphate guanylyltransferase [Bacteroidota bacterium]